MHFRFKERHLNMTFGLSFNLFVPHGHREFVLRRSGRRRDLKRRSRAPFLLYHFYSGNFLG